MKILLFLCSVYDYSCLLRCRTDMNALAFLFQYKKLRRSSRLEIKAGDTKPESEDNSDDDQTSVGLFESLPLELKFHIFTYLSGIFLHCFNYLALIFSSHTLLIILQIVSELGTDELCSVCCIDF